ncbi:MAG: SDR family oxidoreductase [Deltaproteobacteria bacterium]|nr:SDR family oxidoreductase [Deltaproteobacteria bacterium]
MSRRVLVVGATGTIGRAVCEALVLRGDRVVALARTMKSLEALRRSLVKSNRDCKVDVIAADLSEEGAPRLAAAGALIGASIDDLVVCVGPFERAPIESVQRAAMDRLMAVHAFAPLLLVRALRKSLARSKGAVVALTDQGVERPFPNHSAYLAAKGALDAGMRALAVELAPDIRINVLRPGVVSSAGSKRLASRSLLGRFGTAEEVAAVVLAMLDATWLSGQSWPVG